MAVMDIGIRRQATRAPVNPLDKSTVFSIYPRAVHETKPTIQPGVFHIEPGTYESPSRLLVTTSSWWKELDPDQPLLEIPVSSIQVADSIVKDYANGLFQCDMGDRMPGLFFIPNDVSVETLKKDHLNILDNARMKQRNWFEALVKAGDVLWVRSHGNPLSISEDMRLAANELGLEKPWQVDEHTMKLEKCPACGQLRDSNYPVCQHCKVIVDKKKFEAMGMKFAS
jgi:hypothetical protein